MDASGACPPAADVGAAVGAQCAQCGRAALHRHTLWHRAAPRGLPQPPVSAGGLNLVAHLVGNSHRVLLVKIGGMMLILLLSG